MLATPAVRHTIGHTILGGGDLGLAQRAVLIGINAVKHPLRRLCGLHLGGRQFAVLVAVQPLDHACGHAIRAVRLMLESEGRKLGVAKQAILVGICGGDFSHAMRLDFLGRDLAILVGVNRRKVKSGKRGAISPVCTRPTFGHGRTRDQGRRKRAKGQCSQFRDACHSKVSFSIIAPDAVPGLVMVIRRRAAVPSQKFSSNRKSLRPNLATKAHKRTMAAASWPDFAL